MSSEGRAKLLRVLRPLFAVVVLAAVAWYVPDWTDVLEWTDPASGDRATVPGTIEGGWREPTITFVPGAAAPAEMPAALRAQLVEGRAVVVTEAAIGAAPNAGHKVRPSMPRVFRELEARWMWAALGLLFAAAGASIVRWWRLLAVAGCRTSLGRVSQLTFLGFFFNLVVPGLTGGDVIKAALVVRDNPGRRADALISVVVDRGIGLVTLVGLACGVVLFSSDRFVEVRWPVLATFAAMLGALFLAMHSAPRRLLKLDRVLKRLPAQERLRSLDRALRIYADHPIELAGAVLFSVANHALIATAIQCLGLAFNGGLSWIEYMGITAIANVVSSLPVAPAGWGVGELAFGYLFDLLGSLDTIGIAVSITYRLLTMVLGLAGGLFLLMPGGREVRQELEHEGVSSPPAS